MSRPTFQNFKKKALSDPGVKAEYESLSAAYHLRKKLISLRKRAGLTQEELAKRLHTQKSNISRLENVNSKTQKPVFRHIILLILILISQFLDWFDWFLYPTHVQDL